MPSGSDFFGGAVFVWHGPDYRQLPAWDECRLPKFRLTKDFRQPKVARMECLRDVLKGHKVKQSAIARAAGRSAGTVSQWVGGTRPIPADLVPAIEEKTGISRTKLRPDLWPEQAA